MSIEDHPVIQNPRAIRGRVALVTGASSGIGRATAEALARSGAQVVAHGRDRDALTELTERIGGIAAYADLSGADAPERLAAAALDAAGRVDILVANAGVGWAGTRHARGTPPSGSAPRARPRVAGGISHAPPAAWRCGCR